MAESAYEDYTADPTFASYTQKMQEPQLPEAVLKLRGLPWTCKAEEILDFFGDDISVPNGKDGIHIIVTPEGRSSGEAFVEVSSDQDLQEGLKKNKKSLGHRYIEVFKAKRTEMEWILNKNRCGVPYGGYRPTNSLYGAACAAVRAMVVGQNSADEDIPTLLSMGQLEAKTCVRLRGLPFECSKDDIYQFFTGLEIAGNGVHLIDDGTGRNTGEAYIHFTSKEEADKAMLYDRQCIGHRYIEVFRVSSSEFSTMDDSSRRSRYSSRPGPYDRPGARPARYGPTRPSRYFGKREMGFDEDSYWNAYANEVGVGAWNATSNDNGNHLDPPPPPPPPLIPGLKRPRSSGAGPFGIDNSKNWILMRGLPFRATEEDIMEFFDPIVPLAIHIIFDASHRPSGNAKVVFGSTEDVNMAMGKHKNLMEHRYIELFPGGQT